MCVGRGGIYSMHTGMCNLETYTHIYRNDFYVRFGGMGSFFCSSTEEQVIETLVNDSVTCQQMNVVCWWRSLLDHWVVFLLQNNQCNS